MPNGLWPADPDNTMEEGIPGSAFSKGDILVRDSNSSLSKQDYSVASPNAEVGIAAADSTNSFRNRVPYHEIKADEEFFSDATTGNDFNPGDEVDFDVDGDGRPVLVSSTNTTRFAVTKGTDEVNGQSVQSRVVGTFIRDNIIG